jgi:hypothetical protein
MISLTAGGLFSVLPLPTIPEIQRAAGMPVHDSSNDGIKVTREDLPRYTDPMQPTSIRPPFHPLTEDLATDPPAPESPAFVPKATINPRQLDDIHPKGSTTELSTDTDSDIFGELFQENEHLNQLAENFYIMTQTRCALNEWQHAAKELDRALRAISLSKTRA